MTPLRTIQILFAAFVLVIIASTTYAFAASNSVVAATAGDGANGVSGYTVSNVAYSLNNADPSRLAAVAFTLNANARTVKVKLVEASSTWYECSALSGNSWTCDTPGINVASIDQLRVSATSN